MTTIVESLFGGFWENLRIFVLTLLMAIPLGLVITLGSMTRFRPVRWLTRTFVWIIRGTPLMLQLFVVLYAPGLLLGIPMRQRMTAALIAFVINYAAYFSEIYRGGLESIPRGQYEAGQVLGMTRSQVFFKVVLLQVVKRITPSMGNEVITLVKDTALARVIGISEIVLVAERYTKQGLIWPLFSTGLYFLLFNGLMTLLLGWLEKKLDYFRV
jgi:polar amino acid transport system permease protein